MDPDQSAKFPLHEAAREGKTQIAESLLNANPKAALVKDDDERLPIHWAVAYNRLPIVELLVGMKNFDPDVEDGSGWTPLMIAASLKDAEGDKIIDLLLRKEADVTMKSNSGQNALHFASSKSNISTVRSLLAHKCSARVKDVRGQLPLHRAAAVGSVPIIKMLLEEGKSPVNATDNDGLTALHHAISEGHGDAAILLLKSGAEAEKRDADGRLAIDLVPDDKAYLVGIAEKWGLYKHLRFNSAVEEARWDDEELKWKVTVNISGQKDSEFGSSYVIASDFLVSAVGQLNLPRYPDIPGIDDFEGKLMHSARWDWSYDFKGKKIAIIGNGATAAQIIPEIAPTASHLTVFQRTPNWLVPRMDAPVSAFQKALLKYVPPIRWRKRAVQMEFREDFHAAIFDDNSEYAQTIRDWCTGMLKAQLANKPELWETLTPDYAPGCKRVILSDDYYPALARDNVDLETRRIERITTKGIEIEGVGEQEYDFIVLATGFKTVDFMYPIQVFGTKGRSVADIWKDGAKAYYGVTVEDLPNFGMFYGPNTNLGHNSIILMIEAQSRYLNALVGEVIRSRHLGKTLALMPTPEVMKDYNDKIQALLRSSSFADPKCNSWYKRDDGVITNNWSGTVVDYQKNLSKVQWEDYIVKGSGSDLVKNKRATQLGRVHEEPYFSNTSLLAGAAGVLALGGYLITRAKQQKAR
ncbi:Baeyer-Villiger monooxygenase [Penicillium subrubescens]|uniref:Baeyer-Villiger monooxygenase n=1 Tax=Penicillium subrubescens TaxID=1316194 RepID=A0A1Q5UPC9_9EURO|nr:Baeyer-Villiger monooxygenase [Penicillium subrubescens]